MARRRYPAPKFLYQATAFQENAHTFNPLWVIKTLEAFSDLLGGGVLNILYDAADEARQARTGGLGRPRRDGRYELAYLAYVFSRQPDVRPWWASAGHSIWQAAGFEQRPSYQTCARRFEELEHPEVVRAYERVASFLIGQARRGSKGQVGMYLHVDSTEAETNARLHHACESEEACPRSESLRGTFNNTFSASLPTTIVRAQRHIEAAGPEPDDVRPDADLGDGTRLRRRSNTVLVQVNGCWYAMNDPTAGIRAYVTNGRMSRFWVGYYNSKMIDHFTGAPVAVRVTSASTQECLGYPELQGAAYLNVGEEPRAIVGDRGYSVSSVFEHNTRRNIASVFPWRGSKHRPTRDTEDTDRWDRHGIVRCRHCGGPTEFLSFASAPGPKRSPRLYVTCTAPALPDCSGKQSISCAASWRMLVPLWRDDPTYLALRHSHNRYERVHHLWRVRWRSGADHHTLRPKRRGLLVQQLRANVAMLIEWLMICWREGWLITGGPQTMRPYAARLLTDSGAKKAESLQRYRENIGLATPYGPSAAAHKLGPASSPVPRKRARGEDPAEPSEALPPTAAISTQPDANTAQPDRDAAHVEAPDLDDLPF